MSKPLPTLVCGTTNDTNDALAGYFDTNQAENADDRKSTSRGCFYVGNNLVSWMSKKQNFISLFTAEAEYITAYSYCTQLHGCKNSSMITVFVKSILPSTVTIPVPSTSLRIWFNILELNTQRFDITSLGSFVEDGTLTLKFIHTDDLICLPLIANGLNSFAKTQVSSPLIDLFFSTSFSMHLHLVLCIALFNLFLFVFFLVLVYFVFPIKKNEKSEKYKNSMCMFTLVLVYLGWPLKQNFLNFVSFVIQMSISTHN